MKLSAPYEFYTFDVGGQSVRLLGASPLALQSDTADINAPPPPDRLVKQLGFDGLAASPQHIGLWQPQRDDFSRDNLNQACRELTTGFFAEEIVAHSVRNYIVNSEPENLLQTYETPSGTVSCRIRQSQPASFDCLIYPIPTLLAAQNQQIGVPGMGLVTIAIVFAGEFFLLTEAEPLAIDLGTTTANQRKLEDYGSRLLRAAPLSFDLRHPATGTPMMLAGTIFTGQTEENLAQAVVYANGTIGRSPGIAACAARMCYQEMTGQVPSAQMVESITGRRITAKKTVSNFSDENDYSCYEIEARVVLTETGYLYDQEELFTDKNSVA